MTRESFTVKPGPAPADDTHGVGKRRGGLVHELATAPGRPDEWSGRVAQSFADAVSSAVPSGRVVEVAAQHAARLLSATDARVFGAHGGPAAPGDDRLTWHEVPAGARSLAVGTGPDTLWTARHQRALEAMGHMLALALRVCDEQATDRALRAAQNSAGATMLRRLEHRQRVLTEMVRVQRSLARRAPLQEKLDLVTAAVAQVLDLDLVAIRLIDPQDPDALVVVSGAGLDPASPTRSPVSGSGVGGAAFRHNDMVCIDDYAEHPAAMTAYKDGSVRAAMATPVQQFGRAVGSIVGASLASGRRFDDTDRETLRAFADQASIALTEQHLFTAMEQGYVDPLTGLANRVRLHEQLTSALELDTGSGAGPAVLFVDLDGFKVVNDALGHGVGAALLVKVADRLRAAVTAPATISRFGGDEFTVLVPSITQISTATLVAGAVLAALDAPFDISGHEVSVSASIGIAWERRRPGSAADAAVDMMRCADTAMYRAKSAGRGRYAVFEERMHDELVRAIGRERHLRRAVDNDELTAHFQPVVDLVTGAPLGAEALVRWNRDGQLVPPASFIALAEETGLILTVGRQVLAHALAVVRDWRAAGHDGLTMSVNLSVRELESPTLVADLSGAIEAAGVPASALVVELTESALMSDVQVMTERLAALRALGLRIAIDDFGTGYSSLARLRWLPIDILKIDRSFVAQVDTDGQNAAVLRAVLALAAALDLEVVVEGVERPEQREALVEMGARAAQGYLFSPAVPARTFAGLLPPEPVRGVPAARRPVRPGKPVG
jgi:diguanylate cyclase (GGDEF)-like protein